MAEWGALAQSAPAAATLTDAYTVPSAKRATVEVLMCNRDAGATVVRLAHAVGGAADTAAQYTLFDFGIAGNASAGTTRFTINAGDVLRVYSLSGNVSFNINGMEE